MTTQTQTLKLNREGDLFLMTEDADGNTEGQCLGPVVQAVDDVPVHLLNEYGRLVEEFLDSLEAGHEAEAHHTYLSGIGAL